MNELQHHIEDEIRKAEAAETAGDRRLAFSHLERAHVLGQSLTGSHTRVHWLMFKLALKMRSPREVWGQSIRIIGAATKTPLGIYPTGNTGGSNVWFFKPMPVPDDLKAIVQNVGSTKKEFPSLTAGEHHSEGTHPSIAEIEELAMSLSASERSELASRLLRSVPLNGRETEEPAVAKQQQPEPDPPRGGAFTIEELERRIAEHLRAQDVP